MLLVVVPKVPSWLGLEGAPVVHHEDFALTIDFPDGWYHISVDDGGPNIPHEESKAFKRSLRGAFYLQRGDEPEAVLYIRTEPLAMLSGGGGSVDPNLGRANSIHKVYRRGIEGDGGSYTPMFTVEAGFGEKQFDEVNVNRYRGFRARGEALVSEPFYCWEEGPTLYRIMVLWFEMPSRINWIHVVIPEEHYDLAWPEVRMMISAIEFNNPKL